MSEEGSHAIKGPFRRRRTFGEWVRKYFCAGQIDQDDNHDPEQPPPPDSSVFYRRFIWHRPKWVGLFLPWCIVFVAWIIVMSSANLWWVFTSPPDAPGWQASVTMIFGSLIAGATSEGGGSVAFPVFTLIMNVPPSVARDFSLAIQSIGMTCASFTILYNRIRISWLSAIYCNLGGLIGIFVGLAWISPNMPPAYSKVVFVAIFFAFAINLFILNCQRRRRTYLDIPNPTIWSKLILFVAGIAGGILTSISGSGLDICSFSVLTLVFRMSEKVATPTSVILMATNAILGFFYQASRGVIVDQTWIYLASAAAIVPLGAPMGSFISAFLHRQVLAFFVYFTDTAQFILACVVLQAQLAESVALILTMVFCFLGALGFFFLLRVLGGRRAEQLEAKLIDPTLVDGQDAMDEHDLELNSLNQSWVKSEMEISGKESEKNNIDS